MRTLACLLAAGLIGSSLPETEAAPDALKPYIVEGELKADDLGWMRGAFNGADDQRKAEWAELQKWSKICGVEQRIAQIAELSRMGVQSGLKESSMTGPPVCVAVRIYQSLATQTNSWAEFTANEARAREIFSVYVHGARVAAQNMPYEKTWGNEDAWNLLGSTITEQVYRSGDSWQANEKAPKLEPAIMPYLQAHLSNAGQNEDAKNTKFLKQLVATSGWPTKSRVGERASFNAWLLVQHADHDPAFQLQALRLMDPLTTTNEVSKRNYAYLYDRVMLKLVGKQKFGTQFGGCEKGTRQLRPLEDEKQLDVYRASHDLEPIADYRQMMDKAGHNAAGL